MNLLRTLSVVSGMTLLSRITGLIRETTVASVFGASDMVDAFNVAFRAPNLLRRLFAEGAFSQAFIPILGEYKTQRGTEETLVLVGRVGAVLGLMVGIVTVLAMLAAPWLAYLLGAGFERVPGKIAWAAELLRIVFPYIFFISLSSLAGAVLNAYGRFSVAAFSPVLLNVAMISCAWLISPYFAKPIYALAWGVFLGGLLQLVLLLNELRRCDLWPHFALVFDDIGVKRILKLMAPALFGVSVAQISILINTQIASFLGTGSVSWLSYADRLMEFPSALLGVAVGTVLLPNLVKQHAQGNGQAYSDLLDWGLRMVVLWTIPSALGLAILAEPIVATLFLHGAFTVHDVHQTVPALLAYSVGLLGLIMIKVLAPSFYARQDLRTPVKIAVVALIGTQLGNVLLVPWLNRIGLGHAGLALSTGLGACLNAGLLFWALYKTSFFRPRPGWWKFLLKVATAASVLSVALKLGVPEQLFWFNAGVGQRILVLGATLLMAGVIYGSVLWLLGLRWQDFRHHPS